MSHKPNSTISKPDGTPTLVPKLRFPEFRDADGWSEQFGDSLFEQISDKNPEPGLPVLAITQEYGAIPRHMIDYHVSVSEKSIESYKVVQVGDFIISLRSFQGGIEYSQYKGICSPAYVILRRCGQGNNAYFRHYLKTDRFIQILTKNLEGLRDGKMISYKQFSELQIPVPASEEQQKIADCLSSLDELIASQARKVDALKTHKKGLMQQLFPREGETQPRLRFPEFQDAGDWEVGPLSKFAQINPRRELRSDDSEVSFVPMNAVSENGYLASPQARNYSSVKKGFTAFRDNDVILAKITPCFENGKAALVTDLINGVGFGSTEFHVVRANKSCLPAFMFAQIYSDQFRCLGKATMTGTGGQQRVPTAFVENYELSVPNFAEQQRIADCLNSLDDLIASKIQELETLKTHKKGLMQQLFPSVEAVEA